MKIYFNNINLNSRKYNNTNISNQPNIYQKTKSYNNDTVSFTANPAKEVKVITPNLTPQKIEEFFYLAGIEFRKNSKSGLYSIKTFNGLKNRVQEALKVKKVNCDDLFQNIEEVRENAIFEKTDTTNLGKCKQIKGWAIFDRSNVENLGELEEVGAATFVGDKPSSFGKLRKGNYVDMYYAPNLQTEYKNNWQNFEFRKPIVDDFEQHAGTHAVTHPYWYKWEVNHDKEFAKQEGFSEGMVLF